MVWSAVGLGRVLHLNLEHQVAAALQIQPKVDIAGDVGFQLVERSGKTNDAEQADQNGRDDHDRFNHQIPLHVMFAFSAGNNLTTYFEPSGVPACLRRNARTAASGYPA